MPRPSDLVRTLTLLAAATILIVGLILVGSSSYWKGEGSPGTPTDFRGRVADTGLQVDWSNNGLRGGDGIVETNCGAKAVAVRELDSEDNTLWLVWDDQRVELIPAAARAFQVCDAQ